MAGEIGIGDLACLEWRKSRVRYIYGSGGFPPATVVRINSVVDIGVSAGAVAVPFANVVFVTVGAVGPVRERRKVWEEG